MQQPPSLLGRALVALILTVGFYVLAVGLSLALVVLPYGVWKSTGHLNAQLTIFCAVSALLVMYSIAPRIDRFIAPGPRWSVKRPSRQASSTWPGNPPKNTPERMTFVSKTTFTFDREPP